MLNKIEVLMSELGLLMDNLESASAHPTNQSQSNWGASSHNNSRVHSSANHGQKQRSSSSKSKRGRSITPF